MKHLSSHHVNSILFIKKIPEELNKNKIYFLKNLLTEHSQHKYQKHIHKIIQTIFHF